MRRLIQRLPFRIAAVLATLALLSTGLVGSISVATASPTSAHHSKPTIVLVHGAWADPTSWNDVVPRLRHDAYRTVTPALGLVSVAADVAKVRAVLDSIHGPKILVGHSYGGVVISGAAAGRTDVLGLVYSAAFVPDEDDSIASLGTGFVSSEAFNHLAFTGTPFASPAYIAPNLFRQYFAQDLSPSRAGLLNAAQQPLNFPIVTTPSGPVAWPSVPSWYAVSGSDRMIDPAEERWMATRAGAHQIEFPDASHVGGITRHSVQFTALIERAVRATTH
ncbi:MAG TPA: alpha/beta hydrolase [Mycobacteriales bacterium]|nr:alpha/beta hydrolase [Mycobacteriales bacterium]